MITVQPPTPKLNILPKAPADVSMEDKYKDTTARSSSCHTPRAEVSESDTEHSGTKMDHDKTLPSSH